MQDILLSIPRINCSGCAKKVQNVLQEIPGVEVINVDFKNKIAHLRLISEQVSLETVREKLALAKYPVVSEQPAISTVDK